MALRFCSLVGGVDLRLEVDRAGPVAAAMGRQANVPIELVAVAPAGDQSYARRELGRLTAGLDHAGRYVLAGEDGGRALAEHVSHRDGVLLVVAATTWGSSGPFRLDEVAEALLGHVSGPVLVIGPNCEKPPSRTTTPVLIVDGSEIAEAAMPVVEAWTRTFHSAPPRVVEVIPPMGVPVRVEGAIGHVARYVEELAHAGVEACGEVLRAHDPAAALLRFAGELEDAVLVATSPRWEGEPSHWFSTTRRLIREARRPVLVVPADSGGHGGEFGAPVTGAARPRG